MGTLPVTGKVRANPLILANRNSADLHILILTPGFPAHSGDSTCIPPLQSMVRCMKEDYPDWKITIIATQYPFEKGDYIWEDQKVYTAGGKNRTRFLRLLSWYRALNKAKSVHKRTPVDVIHSFWLNECAFLGQRLSRKLKIPHLSTVMGQDAKASNHYLKRLSLEDITLIGLSDFQEKIFRSATGISFDKIIPWGIRAEEFPLPNPLRDRKSDLLGVGSLIPLKRFDLFIKVATRLKHEFPDLTCELIGDGPEMGNLRKLKEESALGNSFHFSGNLPREQVLDRMNHSKILVHPSEYESFGYVFSEARFLGLRLCSFEVGYASADHDWQVVGDEDAMFFALKQMLLEETDNIERKVVSIRETVANYGQIYHRLCEVNKNPFAKSTDR